PQTGTRPQKGDSQSHRGRRLRWSPDAGPQGAPAGGRKPVPGLRPCDLRPRFLDSESRQASLARYPPPMAANDTERRAARFDWHPEPDLIGFADASSRPALEALGHEAWSAALDYLYDHAFARAMGEPAGYAELREAFFGPDRRPGKAPLAPTPSWELLEEFRRRIAPHQLNAYHPRSLSYFTPPPLTMSIVGELLAQVTQQGVDVWHAGPLAPFVEEEVVRWLCDLIGYDGTGCGLLTSDGAWRQFSR